MKKLLVLFGILLLLPRCGKDSPAPLPDNIPTAARLIFPFENSLCNEGTSITPTESTVLFEWEAGENTDNYELLLRNLNTGDLTSYQSVNSEISIVLKRATPYEWYVISTSNSVSDEAVSATWKFYNAGEGIQSYAPFPAEIISPSMAASIAATNNEVTLEWTGRDVDDDIIGYDVYFGTSDSPEILQNDLEESIITNVPVLPNTIYYWKVVTKDLSGNKSDSGLFQFKIL